MFADYDYFRLSAEEADKDIIYCSLGILENNVLMAVVRVPRTMERDLPYFDYLNHAFQCTVLYKHCKSFNVVCYVSSRYTSYSSYFVVILIAFLSDKRQLT
jgi:hypothetical protein